MSVLIKRKQALIRGCVQGVRFRPVVYHIAKAIGLAGFVYNDTKGVTIELQGKDNKIDQFLTQLQSDDKPLLAGIESFKVAEVAVAFGNDEFIAKSSNSHGSALLQVTAGIAT